MPSGFWLSDDQYNQSGGLLWGQQQLQQLGQNVQHQWNAGEDWAQQQISNLSGLNPLNPSSPAAATSPAGPAPESSPPGAPPAGLPPEQRPAATAQELGQQWADQQISSLTPPPQPQSQGTLGDVSQGVQSVLGAIPAEAQGRARQTLGLPQTAPQQTAVLPHASEPATTTDQLPTSAPSGPSGPNIAANWKTQFDFGQTYTGDYRTGTPHRGVDLVPSNGKGIGSEVDAFMPGTVTNVFHDPGGAGGLVVYVQDNAGLTHAYMHLDSANVKIGDQVQRGTPIATMGQSGTEGSPHLHYEVRKNAASGDPLDQLIDPRPYLQGQSGQAQGTLAALTGSLQDQARQAARSVGIDPEIFVRQIQQESGFEPFNRDGSPKKSPAGAIGIAQFMPDTARGMGIDPTNPQQALQAAARLDAQNLQTYGGDWHKTLAAYNAGNGAVDKYGGVPPFEETQRYVQSILQGIPVPAPGQSPHPMPGQPGGLVTPPGNYNPAPGSLGPPLLQVAQGGLQNVQDLGAGLRQTAQTAGQNVAQTAQDSTSALVQQGQNLIAQGQQLLNQAQQVGPNVQQGAQNVLGQGNQLLNYLQTPQSVTDLTQQGPMAGFRQGLQQVGQGAANALSPQARQELAQNITPSWSPETPVLGGAAALGAGLVRGALEAPSPLEAIDTASRIGQQYGMGPHYDDQGRLRVTPVDTAQMTPADAQAYQQSMVAVGGMEAPELPGASATGRLFGAAERPGETTIYGPSGEILSTIKPPALPTGLNPEEFAQRAVNINLAKYPVEVRDAISSMAEALPETMSAARRGVLGDQTVRDLSQQTGLDVGQIVANWQPGQAHNAETLLAMSDALAAQGDRVVQAQELLRQDPTSLDARANFMGELLQQGAIQEALTGATAEAGRALRVLRQPVEGSAFAVQQMQAMAQRSGLSTDELVNMLAKIDLADPQQVSMLGRLAAPPRLPPNEFLPEGAMPGQIGLFEDQPFQRLMPSAAEAGPGAMPVSAAGEQLGQWGTRVQAQERAAQFQRDIASLNQQIEQMGLRAPSGAAPVPEPSFALPTMQAEPGVEMRQLQMPGITPSAGEQFGQMQQALEETGLQAAPGEAARVGGQAPVGARGSGVWQATMPDADAFGRPSLGDVFKLYHVGSVVSGLQTVGKVAMNSLVAPLWNFFGHGFYDLMTWQPSRIQGSVVAGLSTLRDIPLDFVQGFLGAYRNPSSVGQRFSQAGLPLQSAIARVFETPMAVHAGLQQIAQDIVARMELGRMAGTQATREGLSGYDWFSRTQDLMQNPRPGWTDTAQGVGKRAALQGQLGWFGSRMEQFINALGPIGRTIWPVFRIGMNFQTQRIEQSPIGLGGTLIDVIRGMAGKGPYATEGRNVELGDILPALRGLGANATPEQRAAYAANPLVHPSAEAVSPLRERFTNNLLGTGIAVAAAMKGMDGTITGAGPEDPTERASLMAQGWQPYSVRVGDRYYSYQHLPGAYAMALVGNYADAVNFPSQQERTEILAGRAPFGVVPGTASRVDYAAERYTKSMFELMGSEAGLTQLGDMVDAFSQGAGPGMERALGGMAASYLPMSGALRSVATMTDPYQRRAESLNPLEVVGQTAAQNIPGLRQLTPVRQSPLGEALPNPQQGLGGIAPLPTRQVAGNPILAALANIGESIGGPPNAISYGAGTQILLTPEEQRAYTSAKGDLVQQVIGPMVASGQWQQMDPNTQRSVWQSIEPAAQQYARGMLLAQMDPNQAVARAQWAPGAYQSPVVGYEPTSLTQAYLGQQALQQRQQQHAAFLAAMNQRSPLLQTHIPAMAGGGVVTKPTLALIGEQGPEAVVPLGPSSPMTGLADYQYQQPNYFSGTPDQSYTPPKPGDIQNYIDQAARVRGIDPEVAMSVAYFEGGRDPRNPNAEPFTDPAVRGTFSTGSSWWPFQLHYGGPGYQQYGTVSGMGNEFTQATGYQPGDPAAWKASVDFALDKALERGWYPGWYGSRPAHVSQWQGIPGHQAAA